MPETDTSGGGTHRGQVSNPWWGAASAVIFFLAATPLAILHTVSIIHYQWPAMNHGIFWLNTVVVFILWAAILYSNIRGDKTESGHQQTKLGEFENGN